MSRSNLGQAISNNQLIFRSNVTPEISIDLEALLKPGDPPKEAVQGKSKLALDVIKPAVIVSGFNFQKTIAPYGIPEEGAWKFVLAILALASLMGGGLTYSYCTKSATYAIASVAVTALIFAELVYARKAN